MERLSKGETRPLTERSNWQCVNPDKLKLTAPSPQRSRAYAPLSGAEAGVGRGGGEGQKAQGADGEEHRLVSGANHCCSC